MLLWVVDSRLSISPAARLCTSLPVFLHWSARYLSGNDSAIRSRRCLLIAWFSALSAHACCGLDGSALTLEARWQREVWQPVLLSLPISPLLPQWSDGVVQSGCVMASRA